MIYICADDYGLCESVSEHIRECVDAGALNKISVFPNFDLDITKLKNDKLHLSLHLNLVEGRCVSDPAKLSLLVDAEGNFRFSFVGLYLQSILNSRDFYTQVYEEIKSQILLWQSKVGEGSPLMIDSHQHTHMIPSVFKALVRVIEELGVEIKYLRIPAEPIFPFVMTPTLYFTYSPVNLIKQWLLKLFWLIDKKQYKKHPFPTAYFFGILFSGRMDEVRVGKVLTRFIRMARRRKRDIEILFHPGYVDGELPGGKNIIFDKFYLSSGRRIEFDAVTRINNQKEGAL